jgi:hypothetical protein
LTIDISTENKGILNYSASTANQYMKGCHPNSSFRIHNRKAIIFVIIYIVITNFVEINASLDFGHDAKLGCHGLRPRCRHDVGGSPERRHGDASAHYANLLILL